VPAGDARSRTLVEHALVGLVELDLDGVFTLVNPQVCAILGYTPAELLDRRFHDITHPDDRAHCDAQFRQAVATGESVVMDKRYVRPNGTVVWVSDSVSVLHDATGQPERVVMVVTDITERKRAEAALLGRDRLARLHADVSAALIALTSLPEMLRACTDALVTHLDVAFARIWTLDPTGSMLHLRASSGMYTHLDGAHARIPVGAWKIGWIAATRTPHLTNQVIGDARVEHQDWAQREHMVAFAGYPLLVSDQLVGVVALFAQHPLTGATLTALESVANSVALGIERKQAEDALRHSEERLRVLIESAHDYVIYTLTPDNRIASWNIGAQRIFGFTEREIIGQSGAVLFTPEDRARGEPANEIETALRTGRAADERWHSRKDGSRFFSSGVLHPLHAGAGLGFVKIARDMTDHKQAEAALRTSEERLRLVLASVQDYAIFTLDPAGRVTSWNDGARRLKGYTAAEILGHPVEQFYTPEDVAAGKPTHEMQTALQEGRSEDESWRVRQDGARLWVNEIMTPLYADDGTHLGFTKVSRDLTTRKQAENDRARALAAAQAAQAEAEAALHTREQFLSIASHELRTPLTSLLGYASLLPQAVARGTGQVDKMTDRIVRQAQRLNGLIDQLLDISRLQQGQFAITRRPVDLAAVVGQVVDEVRATVPAKSTHTVELTAPDAPMVVDGDTERLEQVLHNLLSNALKYSPQGGRVQVAVHHTATEAVVEITDQGIGIPAAAHAHLFEPFYRAPNVGGQASGFGLGLHIVREIVARHGGRIVVESMEGVGSTFRVVLPLQARGAAQE